MNFSKALDVTLDKFGITGKWLSSESGVSEQMISGFRNGKQRVWSDSLDRIFLALPEEAKQYFLSLLLMWRFSFDTLTIIMCEMRWESQSCLMES